MLTNLVLVTYEHLHQILSKSAQFSVLVNVVLTMVSDIEKKDKCQKSDLENALTGAVLKIEVSYAHQLSLGQLLTSPPNFIKIRPVLSFG